MKRISKALAGTSFLCLSLVAMDASAQQAEPEEQRADALEGDIVVTATRRNESVQKVPISITVLDPEALSKITSSSELGKLVPNIQLEQTSGLAFQRIGIRGVAQSDFNANATTSNMVYLDDLPLNAAVSQGVALWDLERAEILRGPQGTLFGRNATGGAIRYIAQKPGDSWSGDASVTIGRFNQREARVAIGGPLSDTFGLRLSFLGKQTDGWAYNETRSERDGEDHYYGVRGVFVFEPLEGVAATLRAQYFNGGSDPVLLKSTPGIASRDGMLPAAELAALQTSYGFTGLAERTNFYRIENDTPGYEKVKHIPISFNVDVDLGAATLTSTTGYLSVKQVFQLNSDGTSGPVLNESDRFADEQWTQELRLASNGDGPLQWMIGGFYMHEKIDATLNYGATEFLINAYGFDIPNGLLTYGSHTVTESYAAFANATYQISDPLKFTAGLRFTREKKAIAYDFRKVYVFPTSAPRTTLEVFDFLKAVRTGNYGTLIDDAGASISGQTAWNNVSWKVALDYQLSNRTLLYGLVSRGFKGGSFQPNANTPADVLDANGNLISVKPETITDYEVGLKSDLIPRRLRVNGSVYFYDYRNYQTNQFIVEIAGQRLSSLPKARILGAELEIQSEPFDNLNINLGLGITDSKITKSLDPGLEGNRLPFAEDFNANGSISYTIESAFGKFSPEFSFKYRGKYYSNKENDKQIGNYAVLDAQVGYESPNGSIYGSIWIRNLTDKRRPVAIDDASEYFGSDAAFISPPKTFGITLGARY